MRGCVGVGGWGGCMRGEVGGCRVLVHGWMLVHGWIGGLVCGWIGVWVGRCKEGCSACMAIQA